MKGEIISISIRRIVLEKKKEGLTHRKISNDLNISSKSIQRILKEDVKKKKKKKNWIIKRKVIITPSISRKIFKFIDQNPQITCKKIIYDLKLNCCTKTIRRFLKSKKFKWKKMISKICLNDEKKKKRLKFCRKIFRKKKSFWKNVIFVDEKKFNLNAPDGLNKGWIKEGSRNSQYKRNIYSKKGIMIWGGFSFNQKFPLFEIDKKMNSDSYIQILKQNLFLNIDNGSISSYKLWQDNAPIHVSKKSKKFIVDQGIKLLRVPPNSPDINPIENLWSIITKRIYSNGKCYNNLSDLKDSILKEWNELNTEIITNLVNSIKKRMKMVIDTEGDVISY